MDRQKWHFKNMFLKNRFIELNRPAHIVHHKLFLILRTYIKLKHMQVILMSFAMTQGIYLFLTLSHTHTMSSNIITGN